MLVHETEAKQNILLILTDQQRYDAIGYANPKVHTPNLDQLAQQSVVCSQAIVQSPQCQPSRAALLTSRYPTTLKMWWNDMELDPRERTIGNVLRDHGYSTSYFGKIHVSGQGGHTAVANHFGFDTTYLYHDWHEFILDTNVKHRIITEFFHTMSQEPWITKFSGRELHHDEIIVDKAIEFISRSHDKPYFCVVGFHGPHPPYASPPPFNSMYDPDSFDVPKRMENTYAGIKMTPDKWKQLKAQYFGCVSWIDDNVGRLLKHIDHNTIVVFTSDHGDILGDHGHFSKGLYAYEGTVRVPLLMRFPNKESATYSHTVQAIDLFPTLLHAVGVNRPAGVQGKSLLNSLWSNAPENHWAFSCIGYDPRLRMIRTPELKYWRYREEMLFDLQRDPSEARNIVSERGDLLAKMRNLMLEILIQIEDPLPRPHAS